MTTLKFLLIDLTHFKAMIFKEIMQVTLQNFKKSKNFCLATHFEITSLMSISKYQKDS